MTYGGVRFQCQRGSILLDKQQVVHEQYEGGKSRSSRARGLKYEVVLIYTEY